jgi:hypothetical protein
MVLKLVLHNQPMIQLVKVVDEQWQLAKQKFLPIIHQ